MRISRVDRSPVAEWWRTVDKPLLWGILLIALFGFLMSFAASPPVADRLDLSEFHFIERHAVFLALSLTVMFAVSFLRPHVVRRSALLLFAVSIMALMATLVVGLEFKGARRWINIFGQQIQPSEFVKPAFVIISAWLFSEHLRRPDIPGNLFATLLFGIVAALLLVQPDIGQTILFAGIWGALFFAAGLPLFYIFLGAAISLGGLFAAYLFYPHVASRIDRFVSGQGDNYQVDTGLNAIVNGGWLGQGPGEGTIKNILPDAHTDFTFAVTGEEFGVVACLVLLALFGFIAFRGFQRALGEQNNYIRLAIMGLVILICFQSLINMGVNLRLLPAKGMTLPFISYGGSSMLSTAITFGFLLALTRDRPERRQSQNQGFVMTSTIRATQ